VSNSASKCIELYLIHLQVTLLNGHQVYGILMEFVPARFLNAGVTRNVSVVQQKQLVYILCSSVIFCRTYHASSFKIRSARHVVRELQSADVSQHGWHSGQIMCKVVDQNADHPDALQNVHCVLVDFSATTQSIEGYDHMTGDFWSCFDGRGCWVGS
jgi:hypothetical protein